MCERETGMTGWIVAVAWKREGMDNYQYAHRHLTPFPSLPPSLPIPNSATPPMRWAHPVSPHGSQPQSPQPLPLLIQPLEAKSTTWPPSTFPEASNLGNKGSPLSWSVRSPGSRSQMTDIREKETERRQQQHPNHSLHWTTNTKFC